MEKRTTWRLIDTPGLSHPFQLTQFMTPDDIKASLPSKKKLIKSRVKYLSPKESLFLGGFVRLDCLEQQQQQPDEHGLPQLSSNSIKIEVFLSNAFTLHPCKTRKAESLYEKHVITNTSSGFLAPPMPPAHQTYQEKSQKQEKKEYRPRPIPSHLEEAIAPREYPPGSYDFVLLGLGWFTVSSKGPFQIAIHTCHGLGVHLHTSPPK